MTLNMYTIKDELSGDSNAPIPQANDDVAIRTFYQSLKLNETVVDYNLYFVGTYDGETMLFDPCQPPRMIDTNDVKKKIMASFAQNMKLPFEGENEEKSI